MSAPWLSVLIPAFKCARTVEETTDSIAKQIDGVGGGVEIVFDVAECDDSARVVESIAKANPSTVRVCAHPELSDRSTARNDLLAAARGDWVWYVDSDDLMEPGSMAALKAIVDAHEPDFVMCDFRDFEDGDRGVRTTTARVPTFEGASEVLSDDRDALVRGLFARGHMHAWSKIVRRAAWPESLRFPLDKEFEDAPVISRLPLFVRTHYYAPRPWIAYRRHRGSGLARMKASFLDHWLEGLAGYMDTVKDAGVVLSDETLFRIADRITQWFFDACSWSLNLDRDTHRLPKLAEQWRAASPLDVRAVSRAYLRRGRVYRWLKLRYWMARAH
jgi:glycosyltransferase involved in cell wall biosynthesis